MDHTPPIPDPPPPPYPGPPPSVSVIPVVSSVAATPVVTLDPTVVDPRDAQVAMFTVQNGQLQTAVDDLTARVAALADQEQLVADLRVELATARQATETARQDANLYKAVYEQLDAAFTDVKAKLPKKE